MVEQPCQDNTFRIAVKCRIEEGAKGCGGVLYTRHRPIEHVKHSSKQHQQSTCYQQSLCDYYSRQDTEQQSYQCQRIRINTKPGKRLNHKCDQVPCSLLYASAKHITIVSHFLPIALALFSCIEKSRKNWQ